MSEITQQLTEILSNHSGAPFLFVGSGLSRRYLGLEDWKGLLTRFAITGKPFEFYSSSADGNLAQAAELLAIDFNKYWWEAEEYHNNVERYKDKAIHSNSALKIEISNYLKDLNKIYPSDEYSQELSLLSNLNVDGIITTNWDMHLEKLFPEYKVYIGQEQLLFSNHQQLNEIYKIHGCASVPNSLVLTQKDYCDFKSKNTYLAAKLITIFMEHPIVFLGYSLSDENIQSLLSSIALCIGQGNIEKLRKNFIFVQRSKGEEKKEEISKSFFVLDTVQIPITLIETNDYIKVYQALENVKRKIPVRVLRYCKEQLYELVHSSHPEAKICVVDMDDIDQNKDIEFVVGVGVISSLSEQGYSAIRTIDLIHDILHDDKSYDAQLVLDSVINNCMRYSKNIPVFKYLKAVGVNSENDYDARSFALDKVVKRNIKEYRSKSYTKPFFRDYRHSQMSTIIENCTPNIAAAYIPFLADDKIDLALLQDFLISHEDKMTDDSYPYASNFRKLVSFYDRLKWGWETKS